MEGALLAFAGKAGVDWRDERSAWTRTDAIPFDAKHRFMATLNHDHEGHAFVSVKGAPERIISMCGEQRSAAGGVQPLEEGFWHETADRIASQGQRVLALASRPVLPEHTVLEHADVEGSLTLLGLVGLIDPPRSEAIAAVSECHGAGIRVKMITGDHAGTARAIGRQIGLRNPEKVLTGDDLDAMDDPRLAAAVLETDVFARTSPEHKLRLVMALQAHGITVAMTGDGVNDAPALKRADAGIAMGRKGTEAAKEAAELVLADDNFASIVAAVREGRTVYDNIKKVISWTLPTNAGEAMTIIAALLVGMTLPVTPVQILWINLITAVTLGIAFAFEPTEDNTMRRPPRARNEAAAQWRTGLAHRPGGGPVRVRRVRHLRLRDRPRLLGRTRPHHRPQYNCRHGDLPSVLHSEHLRNLAYMESGARHQGGVADGRCHHRRPVLDHLPTAAASGIRDRIGAVPGRAAHRRCRHGVVCHH